MSVDLKVAFSAYMRWIHTLSGDARVGITWAKVREYLEANPADGMKLFDTARRKAETEGALGPVPTLALLDTLPGLSAPERVQYNLDALRVVDARTLATMTPEDKAYLLAYTGFTGIPAKDIPEDPVLGREVTAALRALQAGKAPVGPTFLTESRPALSLGHATIDAAVAIARNAYFLPSSIDSALDLFGVGRFASAASGDMRWRVFEPDKRLAELAKYTSRTRVTTETSLEKFSQEKAGSYKFIAVAPPSGQRPKYLVDQDKDRVGWSYTEDYVLEAASRMLAPGGVLLAVHPAAQIIGEAKRNLYLRQWLIRRCEFVSAALLPHNFLPGHTFTPGVAISVWVRRADDVGAAEDDLIQDLEKGRYLHSEFGPYAVWGSMSGGKLPYIQAPNERWQPSFLLHTPMRDLPTGVQDDIIAWWDSHAPAAADEPDPGEVRRVDTRRMPEEFAEGIRMANRVTRLMTLAGRGGLDTARAEAGRNELLRDLQAYVGRFGNPHAITGLPPEADMLRWAVRASGTFDPTLLHPFTPFPMGGPVPGKATPPEVVRYYSAYFGVCTEENLRLYFRGVNDAFLEALARDETLVATTAADGTYRLYGIAEFLTGDLYGRLDDLDARLASTEDEDLKVRYSNLRQQLLAAIEEKSISEIYITPRSSFVPVECIEEFLHYTLNEDRLRVEGTSLPDPAPLRLRRENGILRCAGNGIFMFPGTNQPVTAYITQATFLLAYCNRASRWYDPDEKNAERSNVYSSAKKLLDKKRLDSILEDKFIAWASAARIVSETYRAKFKVESWSDHLERAYNRAYQGNILRDYPTTAVPIARQSPLITPHPHQNYSVRRFTDTRGGMSSVDVGGGKTLIGLATIAYQRQEGFVRKPMGVVPNNVLFNWLREASSGPRPFLPDYRVEVMGYRIDPVSGKRRRESTEERRMKWQAFSRGEFDLLLCGYQQFIDDIELTDASLYATAQQIPFFRMEDQKEAMNQEYLKRTIQPLVEAISTARQNLRDLRDDDASEAKIEKAEKAYNQALNALSSAENAIRVGKRSMLETFRKDAEGLSSERPLRPRERTASEWSKSWSKEQLLLFASLRGVHIEQSTGRVTLQPHYDPAPWVSADVMTQFREGAGRVFPIGRRGITQESLLSLLSIYYPPAPESKEGPRALPSLTTWEALGCDLLVIDEAHNFKNTWYARGRYGTSKISYMGAVLDRSYEPGGHSWDMFFKSQYTIAQGGQVLNLTATPVKNSPVELFNLIYQCAPHVWLRRQLVHPEEFIDRYCDLQVDHTPKINGDPIEVLAVKKFTNLSELQAGLFSAMRFDSTEDLLRSGSLKSVPRPCTVRVYVEMDAIQNLIYDQLYDMSVEMDDAKAPENDEEATARSAFRLSLMGIAEKTALDPRLLQETLVNVIEQKTAFDRTKEVYQKWITGGRVGKEPAEPPADHYGLFLDKLRDFLVDRVKVDQFDSDYEGVILPKYDAVARKVATNPFCGHVIFCDYNAAHEPLRQAISEIAGIPLDRIAVLDGTLPPIRRQIITEGFNGQDPEIDPDTGEITAEEVLPIYSVIIGNSKVMAEGVNLQRRTCAIHHLDFPWEPATLQQRNGRGVRQGNQLESVDIYYYLAGTDPALDNPFPNVSFDFYKLDTVLGKGSWQRALFNRGAATTDNPLAGGEVDPQAFRFALVARRFPAEAKRLQAEAIERAAKMTLDAQIEEVRRRLDTVIRIYTDARKERDLDRRAVKLAQAERFAEQLRNLPTEVFPNPGVLDIARDRNVFYDLDIDLLLIEGEKCAIRSDSASAGPTRKIRIEQIRKGLFRVRRFGSPYLEMFFGISDLLRRVMSYTGKLNEMGVLEKVPLSSVGGWSNDEDASLAFEAKKLFVADFPNLSPDFLAQSHITIGELWNRLVQSGRDGVISGIQTTHGDQNIGFIPLVLRPGMTAPTTRATEATVFLLPQDAYLDAWDIRRGALDAFDLIPPSTLDASVWQQVIVKAMRRDRIAVLEYVSSGTEGARWGTRRLDASATLMPPHVRDTALLKAMAQTYFARDYPGASVRAMLEARDRQRAGLLPEEVETETRESLAVVRDGLVRRRQKGSGQR